MPPDTNMLCLLSHLYPMDLTYNNNFQSISIALICQVLVIIVSLGQLNVILGKRKPPMDISIDGWIKLCLVKIFSQRNHNHKVLLDHQQMRILLRLDRVIQGEMDQDDNYTGRTKPRV